MQILLVMIVIIVSMVALRYDIFKGDEDFNDFLDAQKEGLLEPTDN